MENRYALTIAIGLLMAILATVAVLLRFEARRIRKAVKTDDYLIIISLVCLIGQCVCNIVGAVSGRLGTTAAIGTGAHKQTESQQLIAQKVIFILQIFTTLGAGCTRTSIFFFYKRIFMARATQISLWAFIGLNAIWTISFFFANLFSCFPISKSFPFAKCFNLFEYYKALVVSDVILDGLVLLIPIYPVWQLQMPVRQKLTVSGIFLLGAFVVLSGIFRVIAQYDAFKPNRDETYNEAPAFYWATIEIGVGIISACLPTMRPLFSRSGPESIIQVAQRKLRNVVSRTTLASDDETRQRRPSEGRISEGSEAIPLSAKVSNKV